MAAQITAIGIHILTITWTANCGTAHQLWTDRWYMVRWNVGQAGGGLALGHNLRAHSSPAACDAHHSKPSSETETGEDVQTFERDLPGQNTAGFNATYVTKQLPLESCDTINDSWGFNIADSKYKSPAELERRLVQAAGSDANLLLNIGPMRNGEIQQEFATRLLAVGLWLLKYGDSIYGTRGGPIGPDGWE
jgi:alpha-L-fucosidase